MIAGRRVAVVGAGPGGYVAAIRAAQLGADVTVIEKGALGGVCLNVGCIPTKVLLHAASLLSVARDGRLHGLTFEVGPLDWKALMERKRAVVGHLVEGVATLLRSNGIRLVEGEAEFESPGELSVLKSGGAHEKIEADSVIVATGSRPATLPVPGMELEGVVDSTGLLSLDRIPESLMIAGGGVIGMEFASAFASFGVDVVVVEALSEVLPSFDGEIAHILRESLAGKGVRFHTDSRITGVKRSGSHLDATVDTPEGPISLRTEKLLLSVGRRPVVEGLGLERIGIALEHGRIRVDRRMEASVEGVYAVGDCASPVMLAHVASREGEVAAENIMGGDALMDYSAVPSIVYTEPEVASVGLSEEEAVRAGLRVKIGRFPLSANGKSVILNRAEGMVKYVVDERYDEIAGVHIVGPGASELIAQGCLALRLEATVDELISTIYAHPTVSEALCEGAASVRGVAINLPTKG